MEYETRIPVKASVSVYLTNDAPEVIVEVEVGVGHNTNRDIYLNESDVRGYDMTDAIVPESEEGACAVTLTNNSLVVEDDIGARAAVTMTDELVFETDVVGIAVILLLMHQLVRMLLELVLQLH